MSNTVFAESMGFFHKASGGTGVAPGDVCLSPPPPPGGPMPVPYVNALSAGDLAKGSRTVSVQGEPTALENSSEVATSSGDEAGTQGGGLITHKTKGKGTFKLWSFIVKAEGKGVDRHGDMMGQNEMSDPPNCVDAKAEVNFKRRKHITTELCEEPYDEEKHRPPITAKQDEAVYGQTCWECQREMDEGLKPRTPEGRWKPKHLYKGKWKGRDKEAMTPDHQPPLVVAWELGGCRIPTPPEGFKKLFSKPRMVKPHCRRHSNSQGSAAAAYARRIRAARGG